MPAGWATTQSDGFYFIWNHGRQRRPARIDPVTNTLPVGHPVLRQGLRRARHPEVNWPARSIDHKLGNKEFDEEDFFVSPSTQLAFSQQPVNKKFNTPFPVKVQVLDAFNQLVANDNATQVTLAHQRRPAPDRSRAPDAWRHDGNRVGRDGDLHLPDRPDERRRGQELPAHRDEQPGAHSPRATTSTSRSSRNGI